MSEVEGVAPIPDEVHRLTATSGYRALMFTALAAFALVALVALGLAVLAADTAARNDCRADLRDDLFGEVADGLIALADESPDRLADAREDASRARENLAMADTICGSNLPGL